LGFGVVSVDLRVVGVVGYVAAEGGKKGQDGVEGVNLLDIGFGVVDWGREDVAGDANLGALESRGDAIGGVVRDCGERDGVRVVVWCGVSALQVHADRTSRYQRSGEQTYLPDRP